MMLLGLQETSLANRISTLNGNSYITQGEYDGLKVNGHLIFNDLAVQSWLIINGSIQGKSLKCKTLKSNGTSDITGLYTENLESNGAFSGDTIEVTGRAKFKGTVEIKCGKLRDINITSRKCTLVDTEVKGSVSIKKAREGCRFLKDPSPQVIELSGKSVIDGDIVFEDPGEVHLCDGAKIKGKIINGKAVQK